MIRRLRNLWSWSGIEPANSYRDVFSPMYHPYQEKPETQAKIISSEDPADALIETIREENTREA